MRGTRKSQHHMQDALAGVTCPRPGLNIYTTKAHAKSAARKSRYRKLHKLRPYKCECGRFHLTTQGV